MPFILLAVLLHPAAVAPDSALNTRFGPVAVVAADGGQRHRVEFRGRPVLSIEAEGLTLHRTAGSGAEEPVLVEARTADAVCGRRYHLLALRRDGGATASPAFGECGRLTSLKAVAGGVEIRLENAAGNGERYRWEDGRLRREP